MLKDHAYDLVVLGVVRSSLRLFQASAPDALNVSGSLNLRIPRSPDDLEGLSQTETSPQP